MVQQAGIRDPVTDWQYLQAAQRGDQQAWRVLFRRYHALIVRITTAIAGSADAGQDLAQEAFIRLLRCTIPDEKRSFKAFVTTTAYRLAFKHTQRTRAQSSPVLEEAASSAPTPLETTIQNETGRMIRQVIRSLPPEQRTVVALRFIAEHSYDEIAHITGIPIGTVKSRLFYAIRTCREQLHQRGVCT